MQNHPTVIKMQALKKPALQNSPPLDSAWLKQLVISLGADDAGFVSINSSLLDNERAEILRSFPHAKTVISIVCKTNHHAIRAPQRSVSNHEFHHTGRHVDEVCRDVAKTLMAQGIQAMNEPMAFPMEFANFPGDKSWIIAHKTVAVAAGMGQIGIHRNVIHPKFGNFILLGSVLLDREVDAPVENILDFNPCLECKLCVAACPVGAISKDGYFNFSACMTHNYREFMGGFIDWVGMLTDSKSMHEYQEKMSDGETASVWQSLTYGANYKAAYCIAVCPAGEDIIGPFLESKAEFIKTVVNPLQGKSETVYAIKGSDAAEHVIKRFPHKQIKYVQSGLNPRRAEAFIFGAKLVFQPNQSKGIDARYHFLLKGEKDVKATFVIKNQQLEIEHGHIGKADLVIDAQAKDWLDFTQGKLNIVWALLTKKIKLTGSIQHLKNFGHCFPSAH